MKKLKSAACLAAVMVASAPIAEVSAAQLQECTISKQKYKFKPVEAKPISMRALAQLDGDTKNRYTEVDWTYFKSEAISRAAKKATVTCGSSAFIKLGDIDPKTMRGLKISGHIFTKWP